MSAKATPHPTAIRAFGSNHKLYDQVRPSFTDSSVVVLTSALGLHPGSRVVELGSGTGKFTKSIADNGYELVAVEPSEVLPL